jgi:hypothetical protein
LGGFKAGPAPVAVAVLFNTAPTVFLSLETIEPSFVVESRLSGALSGKPGRYSLAT